MKTAYHGRIIDVTVEDVELPNGRSCQLEIVRHPGAAAVVPVDSRGDVLLVRQYRYATGGWLLEIPAGKLDPGEAPLDCARREVEEETGVRPARLIDLGWIWTTPGFTDEKIWLYLALDLEAGKQNLQADEALTVERMPLAEAARLARENGIEDAKSVCALFRAEAWLNRR